MTDDANQKMSATPEVVGVDAHAKMTEEVAKGFLSRIRSVAAECGYAVGVHGSVRRDLDLIAVPWTPEAVSAQQLVAILCERIPLHERDWNLYSDRRMEPNPEIKPWGRIAWSLDGVPAGLWKYVDLSVAPRCGEAVPVRTYIREKKLETQRGNPVGGAI